MERVLIKLIVLSLTLFAALLVGASETSAQVTPALSVDAAGNRHAISPDVYGMCYCATGPKVDSTFASQISLPNARWGGDYTTNYNWLADQSNNGDDLYFLSGSGGGTPTPSGQVDSMISTLKSYGAKPLVTIPINPYLTLDNQNRCSFRVSEYGPQQSVFSGNFISGDQCGNSIASNGSQLVDKDLSYNYTNNSTATEQNWVSHLVSKFGTGANGGVAYYQLDNEPGGWSNTHRDVNPTQPDYGTISSLGQQYAAVIKSVDSTAKVLGPSDYLLWGWVLNTPKSSSLLSGQYYLQQMAAYDAAHGQRVLDYFDEHYTVGDSSSAAASFSQVRSWWDPNYNTGSQIEKSVFNGPIMAIPRFKSWIASYYPGTKLSISEYELNSTGTRLVDSLVEADALGVFGYYGLDFADLFNFPSPTDPVAYAFRLFRNYDGSGHKFGDTSVSSASTDQSQLSVYGALRSSDGALTVLAINKTTSAIQTGLTLSNFQAGGAAAVYTYSNANLTQIVAGTPVTVSSNTVNYKFPSYSATLFVFTAGSGSAPLPPTNLAATVE